MRPLCIDLFCGLGGWAEGFLSEGYDVIGFDIERHDYGTGGYPGQLVLQDALTIDGTRFKDAAVIVASPPCQKYSYMAMPWSKAKELIRYYEASAERREELNALFNACFRIQREAEAAAGHHIPLIVENVRGAQRWVGRAKWHFGSYYLWGDLPALMPMARARKNGELGGGSWFGLSETNTVLGMNPDGRKIAHAVKHAEIKTPGRSMSKSAAHKWGTHNMGTGVEIAEELTTGIKQSGISGPRNNGKGDKWFQDGAATFGSKSSSRKAASAQIAKIPFPLAQHMARSFKFNWPGTLDEHQRVSRNTRF